MKKKIALLILMILALSILLVACNKTVATKIETRWQADEYTFNITKADFTSGKEYVSKDESLSGLDEIVPDDVDGTFTLKISQTSGTTDWTVTTVQIIYAQYSKSAISSLTDSKWQSVIPSDEEIANTTLTKSDDKVILKSVTTREVVFADNKAQTPKSSKTELNGFYIGKSNQDVSVYKVETTYDFDSKRPVATISIDGGEPFKKKFGRNATFIDANQLLMYVRSLDKPSAGFQDSPSVTVFDPYTQKSTTATFSLDYDSKLKLTDSIRNASVTASVNVVTVKLGGVHFLQQENLPNTLQDVDLLPGERQGADKPKYTTIRFRSGYFAYELVTYQDKVWNALQPKTEDDANTEPTE